MIAAVMAMTSTMAFANLAQATDIKPYAGVGVGALQIKLDNGIGTATTTNYYGQLGADLNEYFGAELRLGASGNATKTVGAVNLQGRINYALSYLAKVQAPITPSFKVIGYFGGTTSETQGVASLGNVTATAKAKQTDATFGAALSYSFSDNVAVTTEWIMYSPKVSSEALNIQMSF